MYDFCRLDFYVLSVNYFFLCEALCAIERKLRFELRKEAAILNLLLLFMSTEPASSARDGRHQQRPA